VNLLPVNLGLPVNPGLPARLDPGPNPGRIG
jgi:hypothetical protein